MKNVHINLALGEENMSWMVPRMITAAAVIALVAGVAGCSEQEAKVEKPAEQQEGTGNSSSSPSQQ